ncbi:MAG: hypothetical protein A2Y62_17470 [Candidatus Fischerbacteria bacterium RBG_13_37_8]|uniref:Bulb-type lectin domain-containing protein n=1 Tax=Candidatus Fischerbacteria bacterium RBG_13_37_8 TaxID=1817863 RepID=A0A1F5VT44_9BACT|nr:MAG: hypothetical protein A2Y62_17470 [Candidatus Fischerbacteria bacterium RBG_13_37_8]
MIWKRTYEGTYSDYAYSIQQTTDGGFILAGETTSYGAGVNDVLVIKLNSSGNITWQNAYDN